MAFAATYTGARWRDGLPPGVYEDVPRPVLPRDVRMDVAAFIGLTERGPVATPVAVKSWDEFRRHFGNAGGGRLLPQSVFLFFANGGRRCVVVRALNYDRARTAAWRLPGLKTGATDGVTVYARSPGAWGNRLSMTTRFLLRPAALAAPQGDEPSTPQTLIGRRGRLAIGTLIRFVVKDDSGRLADEFRYVTDTRPIDSGTTEVVFDKTVTGALRVPDVVNAAQEVRVRLDIDLDGELRESWDGATLRPEHPEFLVRLLGRRSHDERYLRNHPFETGDPIDGSKEANRLDGLLLDADSRRAGSSLVRPDPSLLTEPLLLDLDLSSGAVGDAVGADTFGLVERGDDGAEETLREHFFVPPSALIADRVAVFADQPAPPDALRTYDERNETQPVSIVHLPDLVHPRRVDEIEAFEESAPRPELRFGDCIPPPPTRYEPHLDYPKLSLSHEPGSIAGYQRRLVEWCERFGDWIAILDLPPGLDTGEVLNWRRKVISQRAALYAPFLRCAPIENPLAPLVTVPPGGAVCGVIARKERTALVHAAPANETLHSVVALNDDPRQPDAGFLHEARINAIRETELGFDLLGSRTTSADPQWTHISVRRLIDYLERQLAVDTRWAVFEPNNRVLWSRLTRGVERRLRPLYDRGAFAGGSVAEAYFVRCDGTVNTQSALDNGQVIVLVGVAPSVPAEFIVFRLTQLSDGTASLEELNA